MNRNKLIVFSAPSGAGKTTLVKHILSQFSNTNFSISATSRSPRGNEKDGVDYHFLSNFDAKSSSNSAFLILLLISSSEISPLEINLFLKVSIVGGITKIDNVL